MKAGSTAQNVGKPQAGGQALDIVMASRAPQWRGAVLGAYGIGGELGVVLPHSRAQELGADPSSFSAPIRWTRAGFEHCRSICHGR
jgi:hypothetical protein